ncbi:MAG: hypothetical protein ACRDPB_02915, partial [Nocardioidaceae bacterium]
GDFRFWVPPFVTAHGGDRVWAVFLGVPSDAATIDLYLHAGDQFETSNVPSWCHIAGDNAQHLVCDAWELGGVSGVSFEATLPGLNQGDPHSLYARIDDDPATEINMQIQVGGR